jgi:DNA-binding transcriptional LysR family regulator
LPPRDVVEKRLVDALAELAGISDPALHRAVVFGTECAPQTWSLVPLARLPGPAAGSVALTPHLALNSFSGIPAATLGGAGVSRMPSILCDDAIASGRLVRVLPQWSPGSDRISAITPGRRNRSRLRRLFLDHCAEYQPTRLPDHQVGGPWQSD